MINKKDRLIHIILEMKLGLSQVFTNGLEDRWIDLMHGLKKYDMFNFMNGSNSSYNKILTQIIKLEDLYCFF